MATGQVFHNLRSTNEKLTGPPARRLVQASNITNTQSKDLQVLDNACGSGILTRELYNLFDKDTDDAHLRRIVAADIDERMLDYVKQLSTESGWKQVETMKFDQASVPLEDSTFTQVFSSFGVFFSPDDAKVLAETLRILQPGGLAGFTSWKYFGWWNDIAIPALAASIPDAPALPHPSTIFPSKGWNEPETVRSKIEAAGFEDVSVEELAFTPDVEAEPFAAACAFLVRGMAVRLWTKEENEKFAGQIEPAFVKFLKENYEGGKWTGQMIALIATGIKA